MTSYPQSTPGSQALREAFRMVLPGGETRSVAYFDPYPVVIERGAGAWMWDVDGNEYVDLLNNYTSLVHGHAHPELTAAITAAAEHGTVFPAPHRSQLALAELLVDRLPAVEQVRFTNSGSEASILAARLARHITGRSKLVLAEGGYHGTGSFFADAHPDVVRVPYNDVAALEHAVDETVAALFLEPFLGSAGVIVGERDYLLAAQRAAAAAGALFVLDEIQALRSDLSGTHGLLGLEPDLVLLGKIIGGGLPVGAVGGSARLLADLAAEGGPRLAHSGTFNGNVASMLAGRVAIELLDAERIRTLNDHATRLETGIEAAGRAAGVPVSVTRAGSILHVHFLESAPTTAEQARGGDHARNAALHLALLTQGVYTAPRGMLNLSTPITSGDVDRVLDAYTAAFAALPATTGADR